MRHNSTLIGTLAIFAHLLVPPVNGIRIQVDASQETGVFKNTQNTNWPIIGYPGPTDKLLANHWDESRTNQIFIYPTPRYLFTGYDQTGIASDPTLIQNYNFTELDEQMRYVVSTGRKASIQFEDHLGPEYATPEMFEEVSARLGAQGHSPLTSDKVGYTIADRYGNGANGSGFNDALELIDFFPERDLTNATLTELEVQRFFALVQGFAIGVHRANTSAGVGAFSSNRFWISPSVSQNPYNEPFFEFVAKNKVPIKAITYHWLSPLTQAPGDLIDSTRRVRNELDKVGLQNIPIWITEYNRNPVWKAQIPVTLPLPPQRQY
ncbi:hypothetical protein N7444_003582 [Penicillium canescens]|nr:hypothetical protein N7444_003582 [Penicillium canescens]